MNNVRVIFFVIIVNITGLFFCINTLSAQCVTPINSFPFVQNFEATNGDWTINGSQSSWAWGKPIKPVINTAANGSNCWVTGGLINGFYNNAEASWIQSPCFDFSNITFPTLSVKVWWETERSFDGASLQYSTDNGSVWKTLGSAAGGSNCQDSNWYNTQSIRFLSSFGSSADGWSGSINAGSGNCGSSNGSGGWVTAKHALKELGGKPNVIFRFVFGAGTQCNNFDGFAIDDFSIAAALPVNGNIAYNCVDSNAASFQFITASCPDTFIWDFNDPASGQNNQSVNATPTHIFSASGIYTVTLIVSNAGSPAFTTSQTISILSAKTIVTTPVDCNGGATGAAMVMLSGSTGPFTYSWGTQPEQYTAIATALQAGTYNVNVSALNACDIVATVTLTNIPLVLTSSIQQPGCLYKKGSIRLAVAGGAPPYMYTWLPAASVLDSAINLTDGNYVVTVKDSRLCSLQDTFTIAALPAPSVTALKINNVDCNGILFGKAFAVAAAGTAPYTYNWNSIPIQNTDTATGLKQGNYVVNITDLNGCTASANITIGIGGICNDVYFPNSFTPNSDGRNDFFGPTGNVIAISNYSMVIYNRYGQQVFSSVNPLIKWDGTFKGKKPDTGTFIWQANFKYLSGIKKSLYGTISIIN